MKVLYLTSIKEVHFNSFLDLATKYNHEVHLIGGHGSYNDHALVNLHQLDVISNKANNAITRFPALRSISLNKKLLKRVIKKVNPDIIHALGVDIWGVLATNVDSNIPIIISTTGSDVFRFPFQSKVIFNIVKKALDKATLVHTALSGKAVNHLQKHFNVPANKIIQLSWGINYRQIRSIHEKVHIEDVKKKYGIADYEFIIFAPRGMRKVFRPIFEIIPVAKEMKSRDLSFKIIVKLTGSEKRLRKQFKKEVERNNLTDSFIFIENEISYEEIITLFSISDLMVSLSESDQISTAILEGLVTETIAIVSNLSIYKDVFNDPDNLFYVDNYSYKGLANKIRYVYNHLNSIKERSVMTNLQLIDGLFDREKNIKTFNDLYTNLKNHHDLQSSR